MKIAAITFHGAYNFGSMLQAYALQTFIENLALNNRVTCDYKIINLRTKYQKDLYSTLPKPKGFKSSIRYLMRIPYLNSYRKRAIAFEGFITSHLRTTEEVSDEALLSQSFSDFDFYISGSDQIWNVRALDFVDAYYLPFVKKGKKIAYAASFGPLEIDWGKHDSHKYGKWLSEYSAISVREAGSVEAVRILTGLEVKEHIDPTLLLTKEQWHMIENEACVPKRPYILMYCLEISKKQLGMIRQISEFYDLPVVITQYKNRYDYFNSFIKKYEVGPKEFLSLINHASYIITSSFHGTAFSILYEKPFFVLDGMGDRRINSLLKKTNLEEQSVTPKDLQEKLQNHQSISFEEARKKLMIERERSIAYLREVLALSD